MNDNNLAGQSTRQRSKTGTYSYGAQYKQQKYTPISNFTTYQNQTHTPTAKIQPYTFKHHQTSKYNDFDYKQKNKAMYYSTMNFSNSNDTGNSASLSSFARPVNQDIYKNQAKYQNYNNNNNNSNSNTNNDGNAMFFNKYAGNTTTQHVQNQKSTTNQFNRFPAFNLGNNQKNLQHPPSANNNESNYNQPNPTQTPKQKRERQIAAIKKQLDQLNKKMLNKPIPTVGNLGLNPTENRPARHAGVSQSVIFDSTTSASSSSSSNSNQDFSRPYKDNLSIDQLYSQKFTTKPASTQPYTKNYSYEPKTQNYNTNYSTNNQKYTKYNQPLTNQSDYKQPTPSYNNYNQGYDTSYKFTATSKDQTYGNVNGSNNKYTNNYMSYGEDKSNKNNSYLYNQKNTGAGYGQGLGGTGTGNAVSNQNKYDTYEKTTHNFEKPSYNFTKPVESTEQTGFKKKKAYEAPTQQFELKNNQFTKNITALDKQPQFAKQSYAQKSSLERSSKIRKSVSLDYENVQFPSSQQVKKFKITDFIIGKKMGKGQFGQVLLVRHKISGWVCGLKVMDKKDIRDQDYVQQIARELAIQFYLAHRNVAQLYGYFEDQTKFYLLIQFCTGGQLLQKLRGQKRMNQKDVSRIIRQVCQGIDYIHKQLIIHRDLKPENILFNYGTVKISDFGWAVYRGFGMRKTASGSPLYYPPEIVKGEQYDDKIDIWNIGMMTYECLLGKIPFRVYSELDLGRIVSDEITFPSYVDVSDQAKDFILKTMKKKGQQRLQIRQMLRHPFLAKTQQNPVSQQIIDQFKRVLG